MHIELTEMLRCPEEHREEFLVLSTSEMNGRMVWMGLVGCPVCHRTFEIIDGIVDFTEVVTGERPLRAVRRTPAPDSPVVLDPQSLQALLDLGGPGGYVVLLGSATRLAEGLAGLMGGHRGTSGTSVTTGSGQLRGQLGTLDVTVTLRQAG